MSPAMIVLLVVLIAILVYCISMYNSLVTIRRQVHNAFSQIDVQLKRRYDLIPNLVETVSCYMKFEQDTLERLIQARNSALRAKTVDEKAVAEGQVTAAIHGIFALSEAYPDLKASQNVLCLQHELKSTENKVAFARRYFNDVVTAYNTRLETFPSSIFANVGGFKEMELFEIEVPADRESVKVEF